MRVAGRGVVGGGTGAPGRGGVRWRRQWRTVHPMQTRRARRSTAAVTRETTLECGQKRGGVVEGRGGETVRSQAAARHVSARDLADGGHVQGRTEVHTEKKQKKHDTQRIHYGVGRCGCTGRAPTTQASPRQRLVAVAPPAVLPLSPRRRLVCPVLTGRCAPPRPPCPCSRRARGAGRRGSRAIRRRFGSTPPAHGAARCKSPRSRCTSCSWRWSTPAE